jgi:hypothetical protein
MVGEDDKDLERVGSFAYLRAFDIEHTPSDQQRRPISSNRIVYVALPKIRGTTRSVGGGAKPTPR